MVNFTSDFRIFLFISLNNAGSSQCDAGRIAVDRACWKMVRVFLCGVGGVGKTTLAEKLMDRKEVRGFVRIKEVARKVMQRKNIKKADLESKEEIYLRLQELVMEEQRLEEEQISESQDLISDRSLIDSLAYTYIRKGWSYTERLMKRMKVSQHF